MPQITGIETTLDRLYGLGKLVPRPRPKVIVGYSAPYALWVHENREMVLEGEPRPSGIGRYWGPNGRAGFLVDVSREMGKELLAFIAAQLKRGITFPTAIYWAGLRLQRESQKNVPVEYGELRDSAYTKVI